jgi:hypothetical protein
MHEVWIHPTKTSLTGLRVLKPAGLPLKQIRISYMDLPAKTIPVCSDCVGSYSLNSKPAADKLPDRISWEQTLRRKAARVDSAIKVAKQSAPLKVVPRLEDL